MKWSLPAIRQTITCIFKPNHKLIPEFIKVTVTLIVYKLCKSNPLLVKSITKVEEGRPTSPTVKPSSSPKKEVTSRFILLHPQLEQEQAMAVAKPRLQYWNYQLCNTTLTHIKIWLQKSSQARAVNFTTLTLSDSTPKFTDSGAEGERLRALMAAVNPTMQRPKPSFNNEK